MKTFVSLFAGVGGFDLAFERHGFTCVGQCEIDKNAVKVLNRHWPDVPKHDDVATIRHDTFAYPDVVTFGSPCQDLSVAGKRVGLDGSRSNLFRKAARYIHKIREATNGEYPKKAVWENVPGALTSNKGDDFAAVLKNLVGGSIDKPKKWGNAGVVFGPKGCAEWRVLDSQYFGVAQRRKRIFLVVHFGEQRAGQVLLEPQVGAGSPRPYTTSREEIAGTLEARTRGGGFPGTDGAIANHVVPIGFNWQNWSKDGWAIIEDGIGPLDTSQVKAVAFSKSRRSQSKYDHETWVESQVTPTLNAFDVGEVRATTIIPEEIGVRRLTPTETEALQAFPRDWTRFAADGSEIAMTNRYRMMGNAVTVSVAEWIAARLMN